MAVALFLVVYSAKGSSIELVTRKLTVTQNLDNTSIGFWWEFKTPGRGRGRGSGRASAEARRS